MMMDRSAVVWVTVVGILVVIILVLAIARVPVRRCGPTLEIAKLPSAPSCAGWGVACPNNPAHTCFTWTRPLWRYLFPANFELRNALIILMVLSTVSAIVFVMYRRSHVTLVDRQVTVPCLNADPTNPGCQPNMPAAA